MKIRRPDADKARKQLERQHMAAAAREARVARPRSSAPAGFGVSNVVFHLPPAEGELIDFAAALRIDDRVEAV